MVFEAVLGEAGAVAERLIRPPPPIGDDLKVGARPGRPSAPQVAAGVLRTRLDRNNVKPSFGVHLRGSGIRQASHVRQFNRAVAIYAATFVVV